MKLAGRVRYISQYRMLVLYIADKYNGACSKCNIVSSIYRHYAGSWYLQVATACVCDV